MQVVFLGTNGWYDTETGNTVCILAETSNEYIIFDAGGGFYKIDRYIKKEKPVYLLLSHFHLDHVIGIHALNKFNFRQTLDIYGPPGLKAFFKRVINKSYTMPLSRLSIQVRLHELGKKADLPRHIEYRTLRHSVLCYGYRVHSEGKIIAYCTDTGVCKNLGYLARGADLFITECSLKAGQDSKGWPHLSPEQAARIAVKAQAKKLALVHFDASLYLTEKDRLEAARVSRNIFRNTFAAMDDQSIKI
jgi:ribonuclease BN (tRNA processing enzyme)